MSYQAKCEDTPIYGTGPINVHWGWVLSTCGLPSPTPCSGHRNYPENCSAVIQWKEEELAKTNRD